MYTSILSVAKKLQLELDKCEGTLTRSQIQMQVFKVTTDAFEKLITDKTLRKTVEKLYWDGHHARAVEEAYKFINNLVKITANPSDTSLTGSKLMNVVFNGTKPILKINAGKSTSERDEQNGYMQIFSGCMTGIRNPRAHECDWEDSEQHALQHLIWANHLVERIRLSERVSDISREKQR